MRIRLLAVLLCAVIASPVAAETFTFEAHDRDVTRIGGAGPAGTPVAGQMVSGTSQGTMAGGAKLAGTHKCSSLFGQPRGALYPVNMVCEVTDSTGSYLITAGCTPAPDKTIGCVGELTGKAGAYAGRKGLITIYTKGEMVRGAGQWFD
jgi:hypothetical protein